MFVTKWMTLVKGLEHLLELFWKGNILNKKFFLYFLQKILCVKYLLNCIRFHGKPIQPNCTGIILACPPNASSVFASVKMSCLEEQPSLCISPKNKFLVMTIMSSQRGWNHKKTCQKLKGLPWITLGPLSDWT